MTTTNRKTVRGGIYNMLNGHLPSVKTLYAYFPHTFKGESPVVCLSSSGTIRPKLTQIGYTPTFYVNVHIFVAYGTNINDPTGAIYYEADAEDILDDLEMEIADAVLTKDGPQNADGIAKLTWADRSFADEPVPDGGELYLHEIITLEIKAKI